MINRLISAFASLFALCGAAFAQPPVEQFAQLPDMQLATLSPSGEKLAYFTNYRGIRALAVSNLETGEAQVADMSSVDPRFLRWADDRVLLVSASVNEELPGIRGSVDISSSFSIDTDRGMRARQLLRDNDDLAFNFGLGRIIGIDAETGHVLIPAYSDDRSYDLYSADPLSRRARRVARGRNTTQDWILDANGQAVARNDMSELREEQVLAVRRDDEWETISQAEDVNRPSFNAVGLLPDGNIAITTTFLGDEDSQRNSLYVMSIETGSIVDTLFSHETYDLGGVLVDPYTNVVIGVTYDDEFTRHVWFDEELGNWQASLEAAFPGMVVRITSWTRDRSKMTMQVEGPRQAPMVYIFDAEALGVSLAGSQYGVLGATPLPERMHIHYPARDGEQIPAYMTLPEGEGPFPTVILPHGGPAARDIGGYDYLAHFFASRGYAVLQPNFRGSSGYGYRWQAAGHGGWGTGIMQHDVTDGLEAMVDAGYSDPERVCIVGWSYGGYAALAGVAFTPDLYQCAVAVAPATDLPEMVNFVRDRQGRNHWSYEFWREFMDGDANAEGNSTLIAVSPSRNAENIQVPVLLIHGEADNIVPIRQSEVMERALERANVDVELIALEDGDHSLTDQAMRERLLTEMEAFLAANLGQ